jgi:hypothetical protein
MISPIPSSLAEVLARPPVPQQAFLWKRAGSLAKMHDLPEVLNRLHHLRRKSIGRQSADLSCTIWIASMSWRPS